MYLRKIIKAETEALKKIKPDVDTKCGVWLVMKRPETVPSKETEQMPRAWGAVNSKRELGGFLSEGLVQEKP